MLCHVGPTQCTHHVTCSFFLYKANLILQPFRGYHTDLFVPVPELQKLKYLLLLSVPVLLYLPIQLTPTMPRATKPVNPSADQIDTELNTHGLCNHKIGPLATKFGPARGMAPFKVGLPVGVVCGIVLFGCLSVTSPYSLTTNPKNLLNMVAVMTQQKMGKMRLVYGFFLSPLMTRSDKDLLDINIIVVYLPDHISARAHYSRVDSTTVPSVACQTTEGKYHSY